MRIKKQEAHFKKVLQRVDVATFSYKTVSIVSWKG